MQSSRKSSTYAEALINPIEGEDHNDGVAQIKYTDNNNRRVDILVDAVGTNKMIEQNPEIALERWEIEETEHLMIQSQSASQDKQSETSSWVQQNLLKIGKLLGVDFHGHEQEALELLMQVDSCRKARKTESAVTFKKTRHCI